MTDNVRVVSDLKKDWRFIFSDPEGAEKNAFDDSSWEVVRIPHDWAISGPFDRENDLQVTHIVEDGQRKEDDHTGRTGGLPHVGVGWYRTVLPLSTDFEGKRIRIEFDGVMSNSVVYVNGQNVGSRPFGYISFSIDITDAVKPGEENTLAVRAENFPHAARWYLGAGIFRNVRLVESNPVHIPQWGTYITTPQVTEKKASVEIQTEIANETGDKKSVELHSIVLAPDGAEIAFNTVILDADKLETVKETFEVPGPALWSPDTPQLYTLRSEVRVNKELTDVYETPFGIRSIEYDKEKGFLLNGKHVMFKGVCQHHDLGALGSAINIRGLQRQIEILQEMGCNAIRTSHNPPAPELLDLCDTMGMLVMDESFDEWKLKKMENGYHTLYGEWAETDMRDFIKRDRNHPSVVMWSIGNEVPDQRSEEGEKEAAFLTRICHEMDPTRPVTCGFNSSDDAIKNGLAEAVDIPGWNYKPRRYKEYHEAHPDWIMIGSENESCVSSRGKYYFPVEEERHVTRPDLHISSYDLSAPNWGYSPDYEFGALEDNPFMLGEFVWTGFDYIGEPTPYYKEWPSRSSYFGIIDLAGFPKDRYYLYRSHWSGKETLHILPHWTWPGREGEVTPVHCYTNYLSAELFINGVSQGIRKKDTESVLDRFRLRWNETLYEPGVLKVTALDEDGNPVCSKEVRTAGTPAQISLEADRNNIKADGEDLSFITVRIQDKDGILCPHADNKAAFSIDGPAEIAGVDNGDQTSVEPFQASERKAFSGLCLVILRSIEGKAGTVTLTAESRGLKPASLDISVI